jgi:hypothetical protein
MIRGFNWIHVLKYFIALWLIGHGTMVLAFLNNVEVAEIIRLSSNEQEKLAAISLTELNISTAIAYTFGEIIGLLICWLACRLKRLGYINPIIAFGLLTVLDWTVGTGWLLLKQIFLLPGELSSGVLYYLINGMIMIIAGLIIVWWTGRKPTDLHNNRTEAAPHSA